jgi:hypothetical protein|eukprot:evm.model.NODE_9584_length_17488_cov_50.871456.3
MNILQNGAGKPSGQAPPTKALHSYDDEMDILKGEFFDDEGRMSTNAGMQSEEDHQRDVQR